MLGQGSNGCFTRRGGFFCAFAQKSHEVCISSSQRLVYHQCAALYIINRKVVYHYLYSATLLVCLVRKSLLFPFFYALCTPHPPRSGPPSAQGTPARGALPSKGKAGTGEGLALPVFLHIVNSLVGDDASASRFVGTHLLGG